MRGIYLITAIVCVTSWSCSDRTERPNVDYSKQALNVKDALDTAFSAVDSVKFRSWNGEFIGMDCDTEIELKADGTAVLTEYGLTIQTYEGTYSIADRTKLSLVLRNYEGWPTMYVISTDSTLLLVSADNSDQFVFGNRAAATVPGDAGTFWPFRQLRAKTIRSRNAQQ